MLFSQLYNISEKVFMNYLWMCIT